MVHKLLTDHRDDDLLEVAIDVSGSPLGEFEPAAYVLFNAEGHIIVPLSGDRRIVVTSDSIRLMREDEVLAQFEHE